MLNGRIRDRQLPRADPWPRHPAREENLCRVLPESPGAIHWESRADQPACKEIQQRARSAGTPPCEIHWGSSRAVQCDTSEHLFFPFCVASFPVNLPQSLTQITLYPASTIHQTEGPVIRLTIPQLLLMFP